jgi:mRNA interferase MazF
MTQWGDVVIVDFPFTDVPAAKRRPAVVVQANVYNRLITKTIIAMVTGNLAHQKDPAHLFIDPKAPEGKSSGLRALSLVSCNNLFTIDQEDIVKTLGHLSDPLKGRLVGCLKVALEIPN